MRDARQPKCEGPTGFGVVGLSGALTPPRLHAGFWRTCEEHLKHARKKHPKFAPKDDSEAQRLFDVLAYDNRRPMGGEARISNVLLSEVYEFLAEIARGDQARASEEAADVVAVLLRALEGDHNKGRAGK